MKKILIALSFMLCAFSGFSQTWNSLSNNQAVSWAALQDAVNTGVFAWGGTAFPTSNTNQCLYKNLATVTNYAAITLNSSRATNDLLIKSDFTNSAVNKIILTGSGYNTGSCDPPAPLFGFSSSTAACNATVPDTVTAGYAGTLAVNARVGFPYSFNSCQTVDLAGGTFYKYSGGWLQLAQDANGYYVAAMGSCTPVTTVSATVFAAQGANGAAISSGTFTLYMSTYSSLFFMNGGFTPTACSVNYSSMGTVNIPTGETVSVAGRDGSNGTAAPYMYVFAGSNPSFISQGCTTGGTYFVAKVAADGNMHSIGITATSNGMSIAVVFGN